MELVAQDLVRRLRLNTLGAFDVIRLKSGRAVLKEALDFRGGKRSKVLSLQRVLFL